MDNHLEADMPLFRRGKDGKNDRTKLERKLYLAQENPDHVFDLSDCGLKDVPSGVFSKCRVFRKTELLLHTNRLTSIEGGGQLKDLSDIEVLDLHSNNLRSLPEGVGALTRLKVLNLGCNGIKKLPDVFGHLAQLEVLNLRENKFKEFPAPILSLRKLRQLDISNNEIERLPTNFFQLSGLRDLTLDSEKFVFPSAAVCAGSIEGIMRFLCEESGVEYSTPTADADEPDRMAEGNHAWENTESQFVLYEARREQRRREMAELEAQLQQTSIVHAELAEISSQRRRRLLLDISREQDELHDAILSLQNQKDKERKILLSVLSQLEKHSAALVEHISASVQSKSLCASRWAEELERLEAEELRAVRHQEMDAIRKREILHSMADTLRQEELQVLHGTQRETLLNELREEETTTARLLGDVIAMREIEQKVLTDRILQEEEYQREAFRSLQLRNDQTHGEILREIELIEKELSKLTEVERKKRDLKVTNELDILSNHRLELAALLAVLLENKSLREKQLCEHLREMERNKQAEMDDFWLLQYQRLLEQKPLNIRAAEDQLDPRIVDALIVARAEIYVPVFAARGVTWGDFTSMEREGFRRLGITSESTIDALMETSSFPVQQTRKEAPASPEGRETCPQEQTSPTLDVRLWHSSECVICLEVKTLLVFLPCGHVCCCQECVADVHQCPLCRVDVESRLRLL